MCLVASGRALLMSLIVAVPTAVNAQDLVPDETNTQPAVTEQSLPGAQLDRAPDAFARRAATHAIRRQRNLDLQLTVNRAVAEFERSDEFTTATADEKAAYAAYVEARANALQKVLDEPQYRAYSHLKDDLAEQIEQMRSAAKQPAPSVVMPVASQKLRYARELSKVESQALRENPDYAQARERLREASKRLNKLRSDFEFNLYDDQKFVQARNEYKDSKIAAVTASAYLNGTLRTAKEAVDYGRYLHRDAVYRNRPFQSSYGLYDYYQHLLTPYYGYGSK